MKLRKWTAVLTALFLVLPLLSACSGKGGKDSGDSAAGTGQESTKEGGGQAEDVALQNTGTGSGTDAETGAGRYLEEIITPALQTGEKPLGAFWQGDSLWLYTILPREDGGPATYYSYQYSGGNWSEAVENPGMKAVEENLYIYFKRVILGGDGRLYGIGNSRDTQKLPYGSRLLMANEDGTAWSDITPEDLTKLNESGYGGWVMDLDVLANGTLCVANGTLSTVEFYQEGKSVFSADTYSGGEELQEAAAVFQNRIAIMGKDGKTLDIYDGEQCTLASSVAISQPMGEGVTLCGGGEQIWYYLDRKGIHRFLEDGSIIETVLEGSYGQMGNQDNEVAAFLCGAADDFYAVYWGYSNQTLQVCRYYFDASAPSSASETLTVYGLKESETVAQAVTYFQSQHPEVKLEYSYAAEGEEAVSTDQIRTLNTQLLTGDGPDVLVLDGLPVESYIARGVLADLGGLVQELQAQGVWTDLLGTAVRSADQIYGLPSRIRVPFIYGSPEGVQAMQSLDSLGQYLAQNPDSRLFQSSFHELVFRVLFSSMYSELLEDGTLNSENLAKLYTYWQQLCSNLDTRSLEERYQHDSGKSSFQNVYFSSGSTGLPTDAYIVTEELYGLSGIAGLDYYLSELSQQPQVLGQCYIPYASVGINAASGNRELAEEFIKAVFSPEVQSVETMDGFPVTDAGWDALAQSADTGVVNEICFGVGGEDPITGEAFTFSYSYPDSTQVRAYQELFRGLRQAFWPDQVLLNAACEEMENCYAGNQTPEGAAQAVAQKMDTYLAE